jgi:hypothetical protein
METVEEHFRWGEEWTTPYKKIYLT